MGESEDLKERIRFLEEENERLRLDSNKQISVEESSDLSNQHVTDPLSKKSFQGILQADQVERYSRQLLLKGGFGVTGQAKLSESSVLVVGAGGIGSTVILYLAASGIGNITVVDFDKVEISNLHRQVIHKAKDVGLNKAESARRAVKDLNPSVSFTVVDEPFTIDNALTLVSSSDCVVDATDNPQTRYIINDACVLSDTPLISGSAVGIEGQLTVYNYNGGPCYRCLYPTPDLKEGSKSCSNNGVLGPVPGLIGILQSVETIKVITGSEQVMSDRLLMYDSMQCSFMQIKKPKKQQGCPVCGTKPVITSMEESFEASNMARGPSFCSASGPRKDIPDDINCSCEEYKGVRDRGEDHILIDVRPKEQFDLCSLPGAINIPLSCLPDEFDRLSELSGGYKPIYCICRRGNASVAATKLIAENVANYPRIASVKNVTGGVTAWRSKIDASFPKY